MPSRWQVKLRLSLTTLQPSITKVRVSFGFDGWRRLMGRIPPSSTGRTHASRPNAVLLRSSVMIKNDQELQATLERIRYFQQQVEKLRQVETNPTNYRLSASGYLTEIDRMQLAVREYLWLHPSEVTA